MFNKLLVAAKSGSAVSVAAEAAILLADMPASDRQQWLVVVRNNARKGTISQFAINKAIAAH